VTQIVTLLDFIPGCHLTRNYQPTEIYEEIPEGSLLE
jgi:hypothetical protein